MRRPATAGFWIAALLLASCGARTGLEGSADGGSGEPLGFCELPAPPPCAPRGEEVCNGEDDDCDGGVDEELPLVAHGPWTVRAGGDGATGACGDCETAFDPRIVAIGSEPHVVWRLGYDRGDLRPNTFRRRLDPSAGPAGSAEPFGSFTATFIDTTEGLDPLMTLCQRIDRNGYARWVASTGGGSEPITPIGAADHRCQGDPVVTRNGACYLAARSEGLTIRVDHADADGEPLATQAVFESDRRLQLAMGSHGDSTALVVGRETFEESRLFLFGRDGALRADRSVPDPGAGWRGPAVVHTAAGWMVLGASMNLQVAILDDTGTVVRAPHGVDPGIVREMAATGRGPHDVFVALTARDRSVSHHTALLRLDARGDVVSSETITTPPELPWRFQRLYTTDDGRVLATYLVGVERRNEVRAMAFACER